MRLAALLIGLVACSPEGAEQPDQVDDLGPSVAPLAQLSDGECPDMSGGLTTFSSGGLERTVHIVVPDDVQPGLPVVFSFHGLMTPDQDPVGNTVRGFQLRNLANEVGAIFVVPLARTMSLPLVGNVSLWGILDDEAPDLTLYDDLRTCLAQELDADMDRVTAWGHSGGALWTSVVAIQRSDTLAAIAEFSGGANVEIVAEEFIEYEPSDTPVPALLSSGGDADVWPDQSFTIIDFQDASDNLTASMSANGHGVVRCQHDLGHFRIPADGFPFAVDWLMNYEFGGTSPFFGDRRDEILDWCWVAAEPEP